MSEAHPDPIHSDSDEDINTEQVMSRRVKDVIFVKDGHKCVIAKDIGMRKDVCYPWYKDCTDENHRKFCINPHPRTLKYVDKTSKNRRAFMKAHRHESEGGWCLPQNHYRHFSKFPRVVFFYLHATAQHWLIRWYYIINEHRLEQIIDSILGRLVTIPDAALDPLVVTCNWKKFFTGSPHFTIYEAGKNTDPYVTTEVSTLTETNYTFLTNNPTFHGSPPTWIGKDVWGPSSSKPYLTAEDKSRQIFDCRIKKGIRDIERGVRIKSLVGWIFHDPFLRFLYTIGIKNAALLRTLEFRESLRVYIPFINRFCPKVQKLVLFILYPLEETENFEEKFLQFFEGDLRNLTYITELVVADVPSSSDIIRERTIPQLAKPSRLFPEESFTIRQRQNSHGSLAN
ncbi:hypothetical protein SBOR_6774 [Sclerotinia borealis F-4128]|uniref:Uncharacterized protein n=1 Tax=Sclerotinia borealis (strain F-4128) TaxID=1432307 RepID=W9CAM6_SCLBF|nr:hypothetical protein SBOR_6774 [Sclerotinia borealis F-4128]